MKKLIALIFSVLSLICCLAVFYISKDKVGYSIAIFNFYSAIINFIEYSKNPQT